MTKTEASRLKYLADELAKLPRSANKHFYMGKWFGHEGDHKHKFGKLIKRRDLTTCGTTACAMGWAATMPRFQKLGVHVTSDGVISELPEDIFGAEASHLFFGSTSTPKQWAAAARKFLRYVTIS